MDIWCPAIYMTRHHRFGPFQAKDRYVEEWLEQQEKELEELRRQRGGTASQPAGQNPENEALFYEESKKENPYAYEEPLSKKEFRGVVGGAVAAALLVGAVLLGGIYLFLLFCTKIWFA